MEIKPETTNLEDLFAGSTTGYYIPKYQRDYSWKIDELDELWEDIFKAYEKQEKYFMGTIVLNKENHEEHQKQYDIVDGQQRLATFAILFNAIRIVSCNFENDEVFPNTNKNRHGKL